MRLIFTKEWLNNIEVQVNEYVVNLLEDYKSRNMLFQLPFTGHQNWTMETATQLASMKVSSARRVCSLDNFIDKKTKASLKVRVGAAFYYGETEEDYINVDLLMFWCGNRYVTMGMIIPLSEYQKVAAKTNYKIEIACSRGMDEFGALFMVWYYNDSKKVKGVHKEKSLPMDIGCTDWYKANCNIGWDSDPLMTLHGTKYQWGSDIQREATAHGNTACVFNFWGNWQ